MAAGDYRVTLQPQVLLEFLERHPENRAVYVLNTARMIQRDYPDQADQLLPELRRIYRAKLKAEKSRKY